MSIQVDPEELATAAGDFGAVAYLLTSDDDGRPRVIQVSPVIEGAMVRMSAGGSASRNALSRSAVTVLWPPAADDGFTLIADGDASVTGEPGPGAVVEVSVTSAVLHRRGPG